MVSEPFWLVPLDTEMLVYCGQYVPGTLFDTRNPPKKIVQTQHVC